MNQTELTKKILQSKAAQRIYEQLTPVYGEAYTFLWMLEVIGRAIDEAQEIAESFELQVVPQTATWTLPYWEKQYNIATNESIPIEQRQKYITSVLQTRKAINPYRLEQLISSIAGFKVTIEERISKNKFRVIIHGYVRDLTEIRKKIDAVIPAHLIYEIRTGDEINADVTNYRDRAVAGMTETMNEVEVI